jgi:hypothetical protein
MTIYQDSKRIVKLSTDTLETPTMTDDFSTDNYTHLNSNTSVSGGKLLYAQSSADNRAYRSITQVASTFVIQWETVLGTASAGHRYHNLVLSEENTNVKTTSSNDGYTIVIDGKTGSLASVYIQEIYSGTVNQSGALLTDLSQSAIHYFTFSRSGNVLTVESFSDSARTVSEGSGSLTLASTSTGFVFLQHGTENPSTNVTGVTIDNIKYYNGVSSLTSKPTNVQDNSILVEKDTGKRYWFDADPTATTETVFDATTQSAVSTAFCYSGYAFSGTRFGTRIDAGFSGIGKYIKKIMLPLDKTGSPTGNCWYAVFDSSNVEKARTNTKDVSTLPTTSSAGNAEDTELTLESAVKLEAGDIVAFVYEGGSSGNYPQTYSASNTLIANTTPMKYPSNSWSYRPDRNIWFKFDSDPASIILPATWTRDKYTAWYEQAIRDNSVALNGVSGRPYLFGHQNNTGSSKDTKSVTFLLTKYGTGGNGTLTARIYNSSGALQHTSTNSILVSSITGLMGSTFESVTFNFTGATTENTWVVCLHSTGTTSGDNFVACGVDIVTGVTHRVMTGSTSFTTYTDRLITITIKGDN